MKLFQALADPTRLAIVKQLASDGEVCACDFTSCCAVSQPTVSHHLRVLREAGVIASERRGTWIYYWLEPKAAHRIGALSRMRGRNNARQSKRLARTAAATA